MNVQMALPKTNPVTDDKERVRYHSNDWIDRADLITVYRNLDVWILN